MGESLKGHQELHKAQQRCPSSDLPRRSGLRHVQPGGRGEGGLRHPAAAVPALSVWDQPAQHLARAHQCLEHPPNLFSPTVHRKPCHMPTVHPGLLVMDLPPALPWSSSLLPPPHPSVTFPPTFPAVLPVPTAVMWILFMQPSYSTISSPCCCMGMASPSPGG